MEIYLRQAAERFFMRKYHIRPSPNFTERTLARVTAVSHRRKFLADLLTPLAVFSPLLLRQLWLAIFHHRDYFAVGQWPLAGLVLRTYELFVSNLLTYLLLTLGIGLAMLYFLAQRLSSRRLHQFFNLDRFSV